MIVFINPVECQNGNVPVNVAGKLDFVFLNYLISKDIFSGKLFAVLITKLI